MSPSIGSRWRETPRAQFARRFAQLYEAAGNPTLKVVERTARARMAAATPKGPFASVQRISDWKTGRNLPAKFDVFRPVLLTLIAEARKSSSPTPPTLLSVREWERLWDKANAWNPDAADVPCPYLGLDSYGSEDRELFFGRSRPTAEFAELVRGTVRPGGSGGVVMLVGASGAGKSSLLAAGVVPELTGAEDGWAVASLVPGSAPVAALRERAPAEWALGQRRLVVVDQLEEIFTVCADDQERDEFLGALENLAIAENTAVVVAIRADFYSRCLDYPVLEDALKHRSYLLGPMRLDELAEAVTGPAELAGYRLEPGLEELVVTELCGIGGREQRRGYDPGALPLLSHVMAAAWQRRQNGRLTVEGYRQAGGVLGSVAATAERAWDELTAIQRAAGKQLLLNLIAVGEDSKDTRRRVSRPELIRRTVDAAEAALEALARTRLITLDADSAYLTHEIVLDAWPRLRGWVDEDRVGYLERQRLQADASDWVAAERDPSRLYHGARLAAVEQHLDGDEIGPVAAEFIDVARGARARAARRGRLMVAALAMLTVVALVFAGFAVAQSRTVTRQRDDAAFAGILAAADSVRDSDPSLSAQLDLVAAQRRPHDPDALSRLWNTASMPLATALPDSVGFGYVAYQPHGHLLAAAGETTPLRLWDLSDAHKPRVVSSAGLPANSDGVVALTFNPSGTVLVTDQARSSLILWDIRDPAHPRPYGPPIENAGCEQEFSSNEETVSISPDGTMLAVPTCAGTVQLWNIGNPAAPTPAGTFPIGDGSNEGGEPIRFSPTNDILAVVADSSIELWNVAAPASPVKLASTTMTTFGTDGSAVSSVAFRPDGQVLATATDNGDVHLWDVHDPAELRLMGSMRNAGKTDPPNLSFSPDGQALVTANWAGVGRLWNVGTIDTADDLIMPSTWGPPLVTDDAGTLTSSVVSPDNSSVIIGSDDGPVRLWSIPPSAGIDVNSVAYTGKGRVMAELHGGDLEFWDATRPASPRKLGSTPAPDASVLSVSADGRTTVAGPPIIVGEAFSARIYDSSNPAAPKLLAVLPPDCGESPRLSPNGKLLAVICESSSFDGPESVRLWDLTDRSRPVSLGQPWHSSAGTVLVRFSPDGKTLLANTDPATLWDISNPKTPRTLSTLQPNPREGTEDATFTPDGRTLVTLGGDGDVSVWDISRVTAPKSVYSTTVVGRRFGPGRVVLSSDGRTLAAVGRTSSVHLWDVTDPRHPQPYATSLGSADVGYTTAAFLPSGTGLASITADGVLQLWDFDATDVGNRICADTAGVMTPQLWHRYLPTLPYQPPCG